MAADDFRTESAPWAVKRTAALPNAGTVREVQLPAWCNFVSGVFTDSAGNTEAGKVWQTETDANASPSNDCIPTASDGQFAVRAYRKRAASDGSWSIYVTGTTNAGFLHLSMQAFSDQGGE